MVVPLPIGVPDPVMQAAADRQGDRPTEGEEPAFLGVVPHRGIAGRAFLKLVDRQRVNLTSADVPGPEVPLYFAGACLLEVFPMVPLIGKVSLAVGAMSYAGQFNIMAIADKDAYPDIDVFTASAERRAANTCRRLGSHESREVSPARAGVGG